MDDTDREPLYTLLDRRGLEAIVLHSGRQAATRDALAVRLTLSRTAYRCGACGYEAFLLLPLTKDTCPMCRSSAWVPDARAGTTDLTGGGM